MFLETIVFSTTRSGYNGVQWWRTFRTLNDKQPGNPISSRITGRVFGPFEQMAFVLDLSLQIGGALRLRLGHAFRELHTSLVSVHLPLLGRLQGVYFM